MTVIYADSVFFLNAAMDYILFLTTARLAGLTLKRRRYFLAAVLGGVYAVGCFVPNMMFLSAAPVKLAAGVLLCLIAFGGEEKLLRLTLLLFLISCGMAGCVLGIGLLTGKAMPVAGVFYTNINVGVLLLSSAAAYLVMSIVFRAAAKHGVQGKLLSARIKFNGKETELTTLWDTGNGLWDPVSQQPVLVAAPESIRGLFSRELRRLLTAEALCAPADLLVVLRQAAPQLRPRLLPYRAVGVPSGLLLAVTAESVEIGGSVYEGLLIAISPTELGAGYAALWGGEVRKEGRYEDLERMGKAAKPTGDIASAGDPLYWRQ